MTDASRLDVQSHAFFAGVDWDSMYLQRSPYVPIVTHELDTQNFEHFDEDARGISGSGAKRWARADPNFIGYTYKSYEAVQPADGEPGSPGFPNQLLSLVSLANALQELH